MASADTIVSTCETLISEIENTSEYVQHHLWAGFPGNSKTVSIPATCAHIRMHYYIERRNNCAKLESENAFNSLYYLLTDENSGYSALTPAEQVAVLQKNVDISQLCFVFV